LPPFDSQAQQVAEIRRWGLAYSLPTALAAPVIILVVAGYKLDEWLHSSPWFTLSGALIGSAVGLTNMVRIANRLNR